MKGISWGAPAVVRAAEKYPGRFVESENITIVKNIPRLAV